MLFMPDDVRHSCSDKLSSKRERNQQSWWRDFERNLFLGVFGFTEEPLSQPAAASSAQGTPFGCPFREAWLFRAIPHKERLTTLHAICLQISRHISQKCSWIHQVFTPLFVSSDEKFDDASVAQSLCGIAFIIPYFLRFEKVSWKFSCKSARFSELTIPRKLGRIEIEHRSHCTKLYTVLHMFWNHALRHILHYAV